MKYPNPIIPGFFPDPSITSDGKKYYLVTSTFQYFPGVALFESDNLVNWKQIGHVLTRESQLPLAHATRSAGIFAPTIRYHEGRFYMIVTNVSDGGNFLVYTDDIYGEWSDPVWLDIAGIDPSLCFADGTCYFTGNGEDAKGHGAVFVCELVPETGEKKTELRPVWHGTGGRYLESPHLYKIGDYYYLLVAEGGTEYGHMSTYARSTSPYGPFEPYAANPVLTNRNLGGYSIQGTGHADLVEDARGNWWMVHLAYRQITRWMPFHVTGRETYLLPLTWEDGWFHTDTRGICPLEVETDKLSETITQPDTVVRTFANTRPDVEWVYNRNPHRECYDWKENTLTLTGGQASIQDALGSNTMTLLRQEQMDETIRVRIHGVRGEAGLSMYMDEEAHYDLLVRSLSSNEAEGYEVILRSCIGNVRHDMACVNLDASQMDAEGIVLQVACSARDYAFSIQADREYEMGRLQTRYISTEVACGFTGVMIGLFAEPGSSARFTDFEAVRQENFVQTD